MLRRLTPEGTVSAITEMNRTAGLIGRDDDRALSDMHATARRSSTPRNAGFLSTSSIDFYPADAMAEGVFR